MQVYRLCIAANSTTAEGWGCFTHALFHVVLDQDYDIITMTRHARNCTAEAFYTYHQKAKTAGDCTQALCLGKDSVKDFDACCSLLQHCRFPVITPSRKVRKSTLRKMENIEHRAIIKYFVKKGMTPTAIKADMDNTLGESAPSFSMVKKWAALFKHGRESLDNDPRSGRPMTATNEETIETIQKMVSEDSKIRVCEIAEIMGISSERGHHILTQELGMSNVSARWVPNPTAPELILAE